MWSVKEVSRLSGVSVRTLHHYDAIGLLRPTARTEAGYRLYDEAALQRLHSILLFRELQFPLKEIQKLLDCGNAEPEQMLEQQIQLLQLQRDRLDRILAHAKTIQRTGEWNMAAQVFDKSSLNRYREEAREKWGHTEAYAEQASRNYSPKQEADAADGLMAVFARFGKLRDLPPEHPQVQAAVDELQAYITEHFYTCTDEILQGLGQMYAADERFAASINQAGGDGTSELVSRAIALLRK